jgi:hypothetical protein
VENITHVKNLLHLWKDTDVDFYLKIKEQLYKGIHLSFEMKGKHLYLSLFERVLDKAQVFHSHYDYDYEPIHILMMLRNFSSQVFFDQTDIINLEIITEFGSIKQIKTEVSRPINLAELVVFKSEEVKSKDWVQIEVKIQLIQDGKARTNYENASRIRQSPLQNITFLNQLVIKKIQSETVNFDVVKKRLKSLGADSITDLDFKNFILPEKDFYLYYLLYYHFFSVYHWYWDEEECLKAVYENYQLNLENRRTLLDKIKNKISLGKINI